MGASLSMGAGACLPDLCGIPGAAATFPDFPGVHDFLFGEASCKATGSTHQEGDDADALPVWSGHPRAHELTLHAPALRPGVLLAAVSSFFREGVPAEVHTASTAGGIVRATAFLGVEAVDLEVRVLRAGRGANGGAVAVLRHPSRSDVVRFHRASEALLGYLQARGHAIQGPHAARAASRFAEDDEDDLDFVREAWSDAGTDAQAAQLEPLLEALAPSSSPSSRADGGREAAAVGLSRLAEAVPAARVALARALADRCGELARLFGHPAGAAQLAVQYPIAVALASLCRDEGAARAMAGALKPVLVEQVLSCADMPALVQSTLTRVIKALRQSQVGVSAPAGAGGAARP